MNQEQIQENIPPTAPEVLIKPDPAFSNSSLACIIIVPSYDADNDTVSYSYEWFLNESSIGLTSDSVLSTLTSVGDVWVCVVTPYDGTDYGPPGNDSIVILLAEEPKNTPPSAPIVLIKPDPAYSNDTLSCTILVSSYDVDNDTVTYSYEWFLNESATGLTAVSVLSILTSVGDVWVCVVTPYDGTDYGPPGNDSIVILPAERTKNTPPSTPIVLIEPDPAYSNDTLNCIILVSSYDVDDDLVTYSYEWFINESTTGLTGKTVSPTLTSAGEEWTCVVTPYDGTDYGPPGNDTIVISRAEEPENTPPSAPTVLIEPDPAYSNDTLNCIILVSSYDADNDTVTYIYEWFRNGITSGLTGDSVPSNQTLIGDEWTCVVTPYDGSDYGLPGSDSITIKVIVSGTYSLNPSISYICAFGLVDLQYAQFTFVDDGTTLVIKPAMNGEGDMMGSSASEGTIDVSFYSPGSCGYQFTLQGIFIDNDTWQATFKVEFFGSMCFDCSSYSWEITGIRV
ncbi:MAG: hypothetical protein ACFFAE_20415 [Candidatus Hodarchaeota archaeon]